MVKMFKQQFACSVSARASGSGCIEITIPKRFCSNHNIKVGDPLFVEVYKYSPYEESVEEIKEEKKI